MKARPNYAHRIANEFGGILPYHEIFYIRSIQFSAGRAQSAFRAYHERVRAYKTPSDTEEIIFTLQEALGHCAAVSRYFWPVTDEKLAFARGATLRKAFQLSDDDPLNKLRSIRNAIEHFDERLDRFCSRDYAGTIFDLIFESSELVDEEATHVLRLVDPVSESIVIFGKRYSFSGLEQSIQRIREIASTMDGGGGRLSTPTRKVD